MGTAHRAHGGAAAIGAAPWFWANVHNGFRSLNPKYEVSKSLDPGYAARLKIFFNKDLPVQLGLRRPASNLWLFGNTGSAGWHGALMWVVVALVISILIISVVLCMRGRASAIAIAALVFPFLFAVFPQTWYWEDGRYGVYLTPLLVILLACGTSAAFQMRAISRHPDHATMSGVDDGPHSRAPERAAGTAWPTTTPGRW